jgi:hypothetical protein
MADAACGNDVVKSTAVSCIFPRVALCAAEIECSNMSHASSIFKQKLKEKGAHDIWINMVIDGSLLKLMAVIKHAANSVL